MENNVKNYFKILPHTADVRLKIVGESLKDLFIQAVLGMAGILKHNAKDAKLNANDAKKEKIELQAGDETSLLIDFLNEILTQSYINKSVYKLSAVNFQQSDNKISLEAEMAGVKVDGFDEDIKAVTYHEAKIIKTDKGFETTIVFDI